MRDLANDLLWSRRIKPQSLAQEWRFHVALWQSPGSYNGPRMTSAWVNIVISVALSDTQWSAAMKKAIFHSTFFPSCSMTMQLTNVKLGQGDVSLFEMTFNKMKFNLFILRNTTDKISQSQTLNSRSTRQSKNHSRQSHSNDWRSRNWAWMCFEGWQAASGNHMDWWLWKCLERWSWIFTSANGELEVVRGTFHSQIYS